MVDLFTFIGIGQCGCRIASEFEALGFKSYYINSDTVDMRSMRCNKENMLLLDVTGSGGCPNAGKQIFERHKDKFVEFMSRILSNKQMYIVIAGLGGGTGGGMVVPVSSFILENKCKCGVLATLPSSMFGLLPINNAIMTLRELRGVPLNLFILVDNELLMSRIGIGSNWWQKINYYIVSKFMLIIDILRENKISHVGVGSIDRAEILRILQYGNGLMDIKDTYFSVNELKMSDEDLKERLISSSLVDGYNYKDTLAYISSIDIPNASIEYTSFAKRIFEFQKSFFGSAISRLGMFLDPTLEKSMRVTMVLTGLKLPKVLQSRIRSLEKDANKHMQKKAKTDSIQFPDETLPLLDDEFTIF